jgi:hypothetical protein
MSWTVSSPPVAEPSPRVGRPRPANRNRKPVGASEQLAGALVLRTSTTAHAGHLPPPLRHDGPDVCARSDNAPEGRPGQSSRRGCRIVDEAGVVTGAAGFRCLSEADARHAPARKLAPTREEQRLASAHRRRTALPPRRGGQTRAGGRHAPSNRVIAQAPMLDSHGSQVRVRKHMGMAHSIRMMPRALARASIPPCPKRDRMPGECSSSPTSPSRRRSYSKRSSDGRAKGASSP